MLLKYLSLAYSIVLVGGISSAIRHNVLFISVDDLRAEIGSYGSTTVKSPHIDQLSRRGVKFNHAYCQFSMCSPSRSSVLTGTRPDTTGVYDLATTFRERMGDDILTLPGYFKSFGYVTRGIGKVFHGSLNDESSWSAPWLPCDRPHYPGQFAYPSSEVNHQAKMDNTLFRAHVGKETDAPMMGSAQVDDDYFRDGVIARSTISALKELSAQQNPFFLAVGFVKPHLPFIAPTKYWDLYDRSKLPTCKQQFQQHAPPWAVDMGGEVFSFSDSGPLKPSKAKMVLAASMDAQLETAMLASEEGINQGDAMNRRRNKIKQLQKKIKSGGDPLNQTLQQHIRHGYYSAVSFVDAQVGRVLHQVSVLDLWDSTLVVLWSDHGFKLGEHGAWGKLSNVEEDTRVPLIVAAPSDVIPVESRGTARDDLVELVDLFPTLIDIAGLTPSQDQSTVAKVKRTHDLLEGLSFKQLLTNLPSRESSNTSLWKKGVFSQVPRLSGSGPHLKRMMGYSLRTMRFRYTVWVNCGEDLEVDMAVKPMRILLTQKSNRRTTAAVEEVELYDLHLDPLEAVNVAKIPQYLDVLDELQVIWEKDWQGIIAELGYEAAEKD